MSAAACRFVWYELMTTDPAAATRFYADVVGWTAADSGMPGMNYTLLSTGGREIAGLMALPADAAGAPPAWIGYLEVPDVDAEAERVKAAGGAMHHAPSDIPGVGRFAVVADPHGAAYCLFKTLLAPGQQPPPELPPLHPGTVGWHELMAGSLPEAWDFYSRHYGWVKDEAIDMGPMGTYQLFGAEPGQAFGGMMTRPPEMPVSAWQYYFNVPAIDAAVSRITSGGGRVLNGPMQVPGGSWVVNAMDPQGAMFSLVAPQR